MPRRPAAKYYDRCNRNEPPAPRKLVKGIDRDLETICLKCLQKKPGDRYPSADALAEDLRRYLAGEPILARPVGLVERTVKFCRRRPAIAVLSGIISLMFGLGILGVFSYGAIVAQNDQTKDSLRQQEEISQVRAHAGRIATRQRLLSSLQFEEAKAVPGEGRFADAWETRFLDHLCHKTVETLLPPGSAAVNAVAFNAVGTRLAAAFDDGEIRICRLVGKDWSPSPVRFSGRGGVVRGLAFHPSRPSRLVALWMSLKWPILGLIDTYDLGKRRATDWFGDDLFSREDRLADSVQRLAFHPKGRFLAFLGEGRSVKVYDTERNATIRDFPTDLTAVHSVAFSPDGEILAVVGDGGTIHLWKWQPNPKKSFGPKQKESARAIVFHPSGNTFATAGADGNVRVWLIDGKRTSVDLLHVLPVEGGTSMRCLAMDRDGQRMLAGGISLTGRRAGVLALWNAKTWRKLRHLSGHPSEVRGIAFAPDGDSFASGDATGVVKVWNATAGPRERQLSSAEKSRFLSASKVTSTDGRLTATFDTEGVRLSGLLRDDRPINHLLRTTSVTGLAFHPTGQRLALICAGRLDVYDIPTGEWVYRGDPFECRTSGITFSVDGHQLLIRTSEDVALAFDATPSLDDGSFGGRSRVEL